VSDKILTRNRLPNFVRPFQIFFDLNSTTFRCRFMAEIIVVLSPKFRPEMDLEILSETFFRSKCDQILISKSAEDGHCTDVIMSDRVWVSARSVIA